MFDNSIGDRTPFTGSYGHGVSSTSERKEIRGQKVEESLTAPVAAPGPGQVQELSGFYNKTLASVDQLRYPVNFPALDKNGGSEASAAKPQSAAGSSTSPSTVRYLTGKEAQEQGDEIKNQVQGEIERLMQQDNTKDDLDKRPGHVHREYVEGDGYEGKLDFDPKTRKPLHMESEVDGGSTWKYGYDRGSGSTPETFSRETISPVYSEKEGGEVNGSLSHHLKQTVIKNKDGTMAMREEESTRPDEQ
jgi:hypothetical protein